MTRADSPWKVGDLGPIIHHRACDSEAGECEGLRKLARKLLHQTFQAGMVDAGKASHGQGFAQFLPGRIDRQIRLRPSDVTREQHIYPSPISASQSQLSC